MSPDHFAAVCGAELHKLFSRLTARLGLVASVGLGLLGPAALRLAGSSSATVNGEPVGSQFVQSAPKALLWSLEARNFFVLWAFLIMLGALSMAGEYRARTLREEALGPIPRLALPSAKWLALVVYVGVTHAVTAATAAIFGVVLFGLSGDWGSSVLGYLASLLTDSVFGALVLAVALATRSVVGTVGGMFLFLVLDKVAGLTLTLLGAVSGMVDLPSVVELLVRAEPWLPSSAFAFYQGYPWSLPGLASLGGLWLLAAATSLSIRRLEIP